MTGMARRLYASEGYGVALTLREWARFLRVPYPTLVSRLRKGWTAEKTLATPVRRCRPGGREDRAPLAPAPPAG